MAKRRLSVVGVAYQESKCQNSSLMGPHFVHNYGKVLLPNPQYGSLILRAHMVRGNHKIASSAHLEKLDNSPGIRSMLTEQSHEFLTICSYNILKIVSYVRV